MGINAIWAALLSLFFWGKTTKDIEEKAKLASKTKTFVYFILTLVIGVFYFKTCQVASIYNDIKIDSVRKPSDSLDMKANKISLLKIANAFSSSKIQDRELSEFEIDDSKPYFYLKFDVPTKKGFKYDTKDEYKGFFNNKFFSDEMPLFGVDIYSNSIPHLYPFLTSVERTNIPYDEDNDDNCKGVTAYVSSNKQPEHFIFRGYSNNYDGVKKIGDGIFKNDRYYSSCLIAPKKISDSGLTTFGCRLESENSNTMDFFTAADLSQYIHVVNYNSDIPIQQMLFTYDVPIELSINDPGISTATNMFLVSKDLLEIGNPHTLTFHVKLPTLANLQLIRSLILTTILAALVSLFFSNLYLLLRKKAIDLRENKIVPVSDRRVRIFRRNLYILLFLISAVLAYLTWLLLTDSPLHLPKFIFEYKYYIILFVILVLGLFVYYQFKKTYTLKK